MNLMLNWNQKSPVWAPQDDAGNPPAGDPPADPPAGGDIDPPAAPDYSFLPEQFRGDEGPDLEGFKTHYDDMAAEAAIRAEAAANVPEDAAGYEFALPEDIDFGDLDLPDDFAVELSAEDPNMAPLFEEAGQFLHSIGAPKDAAGQLLKMVAKYEAAKLSPLYVAGKAEMTALGSAADARVSRVQHALETKVSGAEAKAIMAATRTADGVRALEKLLLGTQMKTPTPTPNGADLENMSALDRLKHANSQTA